MSSRNSSAALRQAPPTSASQEREENFLLRFWANMTPEQAKALEELERLDRLHGNEPTPRE